MKDMLNVMDKFLAMGMSVDDVVLRSTWNPAREIRQEQLGNLSVGSPRRHHGPPAREGQLRLRRHVRRAA